MTQQAKPVGHKNKLSSLELLKRSADGGLSKQSMAALLKIPAEAGTKYALLDPASGKPVPGLLLKRKGNALLVELEGEQLEIENFYGETGVEFLPTGAPGGEGAMGAAITPMSPPQTTLASGEQLIWSATADDAAGYLPQLIGGGLLGLGLIADGSGGGSPAAPEPEPPAAVANFVKGTIVGGPVIAGNGLTVAVFAADGVSKLGEAKVNPDGSFTIAVGSYIGVVIARVIDSDAGADYLDEASAAGKDLNAELFSIEVVRTPNTTVTVNLNVLTTLAYHKAIEQAGSAAPTTAVVDGVNKSVATLFGLEALHGTTVQPTNGGAFNAVDGLSQGETYGLILAAFSGADVANGGNSQQTVNEVLAGLTLSGGTATLAPTAQAGLIEGGKVVVENTGLDLGDEVSVIVDTVAPQFGATQVALSVDENVAAGRLLHTASATDPSPVRYSLRAVGDHTAFSINASTGAVSLVGSPDFESKASYSLTVIATDAAGNASEQTLSVTVNNLDESAPIISSGAQAGAVAENSGAGQVVYTATSTDAGDIATGSTRYSLKAVGDHTAFSINASTGAVTLIGNPDFESKAGYSFTVIATDAAGLASERDVSLNINDLDEVAPSITSGAVAAAIAENSGAGQVVYTATSTDAGDIATGSTRYSLKAVGDHAAFSINASTGAVSLIADPDFESKASYSFTVIATDAAGNASEQAVSLAIADVADGFPAISSVAISGASGALNNHLNAGDVVSVTVTMNEATTVTGTPRLALNVGGVTVQADYVSGSGSTALVFQYTVQAGDADANGISIAANSLALNGGTLKDGDGNDAVLSHGAVADNASYRVDNGVPVINSGAVATALNENAGAGQLVYTAAATDASALTYSLKAVDDHALLSINTSTGAVTLTGNPDHESKASYSFTVIATDAAGNASEQAVTLAINDLDEVAPSITSGAVAAAINENSGAGQVVYTASSTDTGDIATGSTSYSLKAAGDHAAFSINASTGAVSLTGNPDFETKSSYSFTVVATDAAGNASEQAVTLAINDLVDETAPSVASIGISGATGALNSTLNAGDVLSVTVTMDEATVVNTTGGTPRVALTLGASTVYASYVSGSGSTALVFSYTVQSGDSDANGVSIGANALQANGGTLRDAAGNAASLAHVAVADNAGFLVDTSAPSISSGGTAAAINENSGAGQTVYTAVATDAATITYSLKAVGDHAAFGINTGTGVVALTGNPDYETKTSYSFTVVATDAAGNASEQAVSLTINDVDDTAPTVSSVAISAATGALNNRLNAGDVVSVTVTMNEATTVTGAPQVALNVGGSTVQASYVSGSGSTSLVFQYTVQGGDTDANGISIGANALQLNGGTLRDAASNNATLTHGAVADNASYLVDTSGPTLSSSTPADNATAIAVGNNIVLNFSETVLAGSGNIVISNGGGDTRTISIADASQVSISGSTLTINPTADLNAGASYNVQMASGVLTDQAGNAYAGISNTTTLNFDTASAVNSSIVVFDLVQGVSSSHSSRTFEAGKSYTIYIRVDSNSGALSTDGNGLGPADAWYVWNGASNLGADDKIVLVGSGLPVKGALQGVVNAIEASNSLEARWATNFSYAARVTRNGDVYRSGTTGPNGRADLWNGGWNVNPNAGSAFVNVYLDAMPGGVLTSQGLA